MDACTRCRAPLPEGARFCPACGAELEPRPAAEERKLATVLFADLVGSTQLGEQDPERTRVTMDRFYDAMAAEVDRSGGTLEKFAGDAVMAAFGAPASLEDHAERALHAALAMQRRLAELFGGELQLRIGVNTGDVVVGRPREGSSFVTGDAVNVGARLEQAAAAGEVLAGERTVAAARGAFEFGRPRSVEAKGKPEGVACRPVVRALSLMRPRGVSGLHAAFVGRETELELLQTTYRRVAETGEPHLVSVIGEAGVGKTRLLRELWQWLAAQGPEPYQRTGRCLAYGQFTYWPLGEVLKEHLGILESDSPAQVREQLGSREILGLALGLDLARDLHPLAVRDRLHDAWVEFLADLAAERPVVLLVEDLHWAEEPLLDLLERLTRDVRGPLLLLATARPEVLDARAAWGGGRRNASMLWLEPLEQRDSSLLLDRLLAAELPRRLRDVVVERAEGNPFFVEELVGALIDSGVLVREVGWHVRDLPDDFAVPDSVQAILAARIDLLPPAEKAALQAAAVLGRIFWRGPVSELLDGAEPDFALLEDRDFVRRRSGSTLAGDVEYAFKHALTREVAYAGLPKSRRAPLHARFADWLEREGHGRDEHAGLLAHHYAEAVRPEDVDLAWSDEPSELARLRGKALHWLSRAAELALSRYALDDTVGLLRRAAELESDPEALSALWRRIGYANALKFDADEFVGAMNRALEATSDPSTKGAVYAELALQASQRAGMWPQAIEQRVVDAWIESALELAGPESPDRVKALLARVFWHYEGGEVLEASALAERIGDPVLRTIAWRARSIVAFQEHDYDQSLAWAQRTFELLDEISDPEQEVEAYELLVPAAAALGRFREARRLAKIHDELLSRMSPHHRVHGVSMLLEVEELAAGWETVRALTPRVEQTVEANLATPCVRNPRCLLIAALAHEKLGDARAARRLEESADAMPVDPLPVILNPVRVRLALARGELAFASRDFGEGTRRHRYWFGLAATSAQLDLLAALGERGRVEELAESIPAANVYLRAFAVRALGLVREDRELLEQAAASFDRMSLARHTAETRALL